MNCWAGSDCPAFDAADKTEAPLFFLGPVLRATYIPRTEAPAAPLPANACKPRDVVYTVTWSAPRLA